MTHEVESLNKTHIAARDDNRKLALLVAIERIPKAKEIDIIQATGLPKRCIYAMIVALSKMNVVIERTNGRRYGYFRIADSGVYDIQIAPKVLKQNYPEVFAQIELIAEAKEALAAEEKVQSTPPRINITPINQPYNLPADTVRMLK